MDMTSNSVTYGSERSSKHLSYNHLANKFCAEDQACKLLMYADAQHPIPAHSLATEIKIPTPMKARMSRLHNVLIVTCEIGHLSRECLCGLSRTW